MKNLLTAFVFIFSSMVYAQEKELTFMVGTVKRRAILVNEQTGKSPWPAVIVLHGGNGNAEIQRKRTGFDEVAKKEKFTVIYAEGTSWRPGLHAWNTGYLLRRQVGEANDLDYFDTLLDLLIKDYRIDPQNIFMTGGSNGAMMTLVYAVNRAERLAGIAPVVGAMFSFDKKPSRPVPVLMINGKMDNEVPIEGGMSRNPLVRRGQLAPYKPLDETISFWVSINQSQEVPTIQTSGTVTTKRFSKKASGVETVSIVDFSGGHGWPGTDSAREDNTPIQSFRGAEKVWEFFKSHLRNEKN
jgi:polyhydroxybutyrate depolymerase